MSKLDPYIQYALVVLATLHTAFLASSFSYPSVLLWLVVLANAQVSRLFKTPEPTVTVEPDAELRKEIEDLKSKVSGLHLAKSMTRRQ